MKKTLMIALGICVGILGPIFAANIKLASDVWPPFTDAPENPQIAIELVHEALLRAGYNAETSILEFDAVVQGIQARNFDGSAAFWRNDEREEFLLFSQPYLENRLILVGRKGANVDAEQMTDLVGKKVAIVGGYAYGEDLGRDSGPVFLEGSNDQQNLQLLLEGQADFMLVDELVINFLLKNQREEAEKYLEIGTTTLIQKSLHFVVLKDSPSAESIISLFDEEIQKMLADGTYNRILGVNWIRADIDGDGRLELVMGDTGAGSTDPPAEGYAITKPKEEGQKDNALDRFWIEGQLYQDWDDVPEQYKYKVPSLEDSKDPGMTLFQFEF